MSRSLTSIYYLFYFAHAHCCLKFIMYNKAAVTIVLEFVAKRKRKNKTNHKSAPLFSRIIGGTVRAGLVKVLAKSKLITSDHFPCLTKFPLNKPIILNRKVTDTFF
jgi:hypothetical protein